MDLEGYHKASMVTKKLHQLTCTAGNNLQVHLKSLPAIPLHLEHQDSLLLGLLQLDAQGVSFTGTALMPMLTT
jgi:hypothetical protein